MNEVQVIFNPVAGRGRLMRQRDVLERTARQLGLAIDWWPTEAPGHATELARRAADRGAPVVFAFGGDGTYNEVARGLHGSDTSIGLLPGGTSSVLAYEFDIPRQADRALSVLIAGHDREARVGRTDHGDMFLLMLSVGPDSVILQRLPAWMKRRGGKVGVTVQALVEFVRGGLPSLRVTAEEWSETGGWIIAGNSRFYGGPYRATPGADPFAPDLEVVVQRGVGRASAVPFFFSIPSGRHLDRPDVVRRCVSRIRVESSAGATDVPYQVDGDPAGTLPVEAWIDPCPLRVRLPS
jgi:diacylglycerol kinase (ATP)